MDASCFYLLLAKSILTACKGGSSCWAHNLPSSSCEFLLHTKNPRDKDFSWMLGKKWTIAGATCAQVVTFQAGTYSKLFVNKTLQVLKFDS